MAALREPRRNENIPKVDVCMGPNGGAYSIAVY